jgi:hypothetical protein
MGGRVEIEADDIPQFFSELRITRRLKLRTQCDCN